MLNRAEPAEVPVNWQSIAHRGHADVFGKARRDPPKAQEGHIPPGVPLLTVPTLREPRTACRPVQPRYGHNRAFMLYVCTCAYVKGSDR